MKDDLFFNMDHGYVEGLCRGFKSGILKASDYHNLVQCETLEGNISIFLFS
jgi:V-type H+-transporting ATPase subunit d